MKFAEIISAIEKFLNDILGNIIPGGLLILGLSHIGVLDHFGVKKYDLSQPGELFIIIFAAYILGHVIDTLNTVGRVILKRVSYSFQQHNKRRIAKESLNSQIDNGDIHQSDGGVVHSARDENNEHRSGVSANGGAPNNIKFEQSRHIFRHWVNFQLSQADFMKSLGDHSKTRFEDDEDSDLRSIAMTMNEEATYLSRRFKFIELLCRGTATVLMILTSISLYYLAKGLIQVEPLSVRLLLVVGTSAFFAPLLYMRANAFYRRSNTACYDCVVADILIAQSKITPNTKIVKADKK